MKLFAGSGSMTRRLMMLPLIPFMAVIIQACNQDPFPEPSRKVTIEILDESSSLPAKVSIFFKVKSLNNVPISGLSASDFIVYEKGTNDTEYNEISAFESNAQINPDNQNFVFSTALVLDLSGSVTQNSLEELKSSVTDFVELFMPATSDNSTQMGIWWFDGDKDLHLLSDFTFSRADLLASVATLSDSLSSDPSTNLYGAVINGAAIARDEVLTNEALGNISAASVVLFTDGTDQAALESLTDANRAIDGAGSQVSFLTIGLGDEIDKKILQELGRDGFAFAENNAELNGIFQQFAQHISDEANSYYRFEYCSPKRSGKVYLKLEVNTKLDGKKKKGEVETSFDATGFTGGC